MVAFCYIHETSSSLSVQEVMPSRMSTITLQHLTPSQLRARMTTAIATDRSQPGGFQALRDVAL